ncbi:MAG: M56 family metallopeptidase [Myxococcota bacterium]
MTPTLLLRSSLVLATALGLSAAPLPAATRRDLLTLGALSTLALPALQRLPSFPVPAPAMSAGPSSPVAAVTGAWATLQEPATTMAASWPVLEALTAVWALGVLVCAVRVAVGVWAVHRLGRGLLPIDREWAESVDRVSAGVPVRLHPGVASPMVVGWLRPSVLVPAADWSADRRDRALRHELAHVASRDTLRLALGHVLTAVLWFHPLAWALSARLRHTVEHAADAVVLASGVSRTAYATDLIELARHVHARPLVAALGGSPLEQRIRALVGPERPVLPGWMRGGVVAGLLGTTAVVGLAGSPAVAGSIAASPTDVQALVDAEVARLVAEWHPDGVSVVVLETRSDRVAATGTHGVVQPWAPGSVVKPFVAVAALENGADPDALRHLLEVSDNAGFVALAEQLGSGVVSERFAQHGVHGSAALAPADLALGQFPMSTEALAHAYARLDASVAGRQVRELLVSVVEGPEGTGRRAAVAGREVAGKTGTSRLEGPGDRTVASFVGVVPAGAPRWVVAVQVAGPEPQGWGGAVAAPAFARIAAGLP